MGCARETFSLWFYLGFWENYAGRGKRKWRFPEFIKYKKWRGRWFVQDTFLTYWNRFLGCKLTEHKITVINDDNDVKRNFCFKCYRDVSPKSK